MFVGLLTVLAVVFGAVFLLMPELAAGGAFPGTMSGAALILVLEVLGGSAGAFVATLLAPRARHAHGWSLGFLVLIVDVLVVAAPDSPWPRGAAAILLALVPVQTWAGVRLAEWARPPRSKARATAA